MCLDIHMRTGRQWEQNSNRCWKQASLYDHQESGLHLLYWWVRRMAVWGGVWTTGNLMQWPGPMLTPCWGSMTWSTKWGRGSILPPSTWLYRGYQQVPVAQNSQHLTAFTTNVLWSLSTPGDAFCRLSGAPATYLPTRDGPAAGMCRGVHCRIPRWPNYLQRVLGGSSQSCGGGALTAAQPDWQWKQRSANLCRRTQYVYLGHIVGNDLVEPEASKVGAMWSFLQTAIKKQVRGFLGFSRYYWKCIPGYATLAAPLRDLTRKSAPNQVMWTPPCGQAFRVLKKRLCSTPVLWSPDFTHGFVLYRRILLTETLELCWVSWMMRDRIIL